MCNRTRDIVPPLLSKPDPDITHNAIPQIASEISDRLQLSGHFGEMGPCFKQKKNKKNTKQGPHNLHLGVLCLFYETGDGDVTRALRK